VLGSQFALGRSSDSATRLFRQRWNAAHDAGVGMGELVGPGMVGAFFSPYVTMQKFWDALVAAT